MQDNDNQGVLAMAGGTLVLSDIIEAVVANDEVVAVNDVDDDVDLDSDVLQMEDYDASNGTISITSFAQRAYLAYAMSVVKGRALPSIEDGQKPVQRRILFAMKELGNWHDAAYKKSARIVGDVIGKYHPHGDSSVYEAAVRMAQDFTLRYPLIEGQGNFGSRDGDTAAAMRYTEIRLSQFAQEILLQDMDRGTIDFCENYDESLKEPKLMPARLPIVLLNGATGIAVGMATDIPPHNIREVCSACIELLKLENLGQVISDDAVLDLIKGPDFAGGGHVISSPEDVKKVYLSGRGSIRVRAKWIVEPLAKGHWQIVITELPPCSFDGKEIGDRKVTGTARILAEIDEMLSPKMEKGKKSLTLKQQSLKASLLNLLDKARDDSDEKHPIRIILEPKNSKVSPDELMSILLANTVLEGNSKINLVSIGRDGKPLQKNVPTILREWSTFRMDVLERKLKFRHVELINRLHILDGRMIAFLNIDKVIKVIRESDDPKIELIKAFSLSEIQAEDILEIRLRQLARLEGIKIEQEIKRLLEEKVDIEHLLSNDTARREHLISDITKDVNKYGDDRRTLIKEAEKVTLSKIDVIVDELITVILSKNGYIRIRNGHGIDVSTITWKPGDSKFKILETRSIYPIIMLDSTGRSFSLKSTDIPGGKGDGLPITSLLEIQTSKIVHFLSAEPTEKILISSSSSYGFICNVADMVSKQKAGKRFLTIGENDEILEPEIVGLKSKFFALSSDGKAVIYDIKEIKLLDGGKGVILIGLNDKEKLIRVKTFTDSMAIIGKTSSGNIMEFVINSRNIAKWISKRAKKGIGLPINFAEILEIK